MCTMGATRQLAIPLNISKVINVEPVGTLLEKHVKVVDSAGSLGDTVKADRRVDLVGVTSVLCKVGDSRLGWWRKAQVGVRDTWVASRRNRACSSVVLEVAVFVLKAICVAVNEIVAHGVSDHLWVWRVARTNNNHRAKVDLTVFVASKKTFRAKFTERIDHRLPHVWVCGRLGLSKNHNGTDSTKAFGKVLVPVRVGCRLVLGISVELLYVGIRVLVRVLALYNLQNTVDRLRLERLGMVDTEWRVCHIQFLLVFIVPEVGLKTQNAMIKGIVNRAMVDIVIVRVK